MQPTSSSASRLRTCPSATPAVVIPPSLIVNKRCMLCHECPRGPAGFSATAEARAVPRLRTHKKLLHLKTAAHCCLPSRATSVSIPSLGFNARRSWWVWLDTRSCVHPSPGITWRSASVTWHTVHCSTGKERRTIVLAKPGGLNNWRIVTVDRHHQAAPQCSGKALPVTPFMAIQNSPSGWVDQETLQRVGRA